MEPSQTYRIGELAQLTGVTVEALRYYERRGLLNAPPRTDGGLRRYGREAVGQVGFIRQAQALGLTLDDIHQLIAGARHRKGANCRRVRDLLAHRISEVDERLSQLKQLRRTLSEHLEACDVALGQVSEPACPTFEALDAPTSPRKVAQSRS